MVPNVIQITSKLATLNDQQLQQYAQMHQEDAYVLALAVSEKNRRAALRNSAQAQQAPQGTVAEQEVAEMAPAGISTLEAPAIDEIGMADGGVVGYQAGGDLGRLATREELEAAYEDWQRKRAPWYLPEPKANMEAELAERRYEDLLSGRARIGAPVTPAEAANNRTALNQADAGLRSLPAAAAAAPAAPPVPDKPLTAAPTGGAPRPTPAQKTPHVATDGVGGGTTTPAPVQAVEQPAPGGLEALLMQSNRGLEAGQKAYADALRQQGDDAVEAQRERLRSFEERQKAAEKADDPQRKRIEEAQEKQRERRENAWVPALIQGAAAALISRDRRPLARLAQGINAGMVQYTSNLEAIDKAEERLRGELDTLDALKAKAAAASGEQRDELQALVRDAESKAKNSMGMWLAEQQINTSSKTREKILEAVLQERRDARQGEQRMKELEYQRGTSLQQAQVSAGGRSGSSEFTRVKEIADLQSKVYDVLSKNPLFLSMPFEQQKKMFDQQMQMLLEGNAGLGEAMFVTKPAGGAQIRRSSAMAQ
jgi:hypothetical protein